MKENSSQKINNTIILFFSALTIFILRHKLERVSETVELITQSYLNVMQSIMLCTRADLP